jgi:hypothetical protein
MGAAAQDQQWQGWRPAQPSVTTWSCKFTRKWFEGVAAPPFEGAAR